MRIALLHLSDLHIRTDRQHFLSNSEASERVLNGVRARLGEHSVDACFLVITGDIAYHGLQPEYEVAGRFVDHLIEGLREDPNRSCEPVFVPGNHDCDFNTEYGESKLRSLLLTAEKLEEVSTAEEAAPMLCLQLPFRQFADSYMPATSRTIRHYGPCVDAHDFTVSGAKVRFYLLNTAWMSQREEIYGKLLFPTAGLSVPDANWPDVAVVLQHHPAGWFRPSNRREISRRLESLADLVLTGHEHESSDNRVDRAGGAQMDYIEGYALHCDGEPSSAFKVIILDSEIGSQITYDMALQNDVYAPVNVTPIGQPLRRNPKRFEQDFSWDEKGREFAFDLGLPVAHERRDHVTLDELFVYPLVRESRELTDKKPGARLSFDTIPWVGNKTVVLGSDLCGKTTLAKRLFAEARLKHDLVPVYVRGIDVTGSKVAVCNRLIETAFKLHYLTPAERFLQLPKERRVLIIDDLHKSKLRGAALDAVVRWCDRQFGTIIIIVDNVLMLDELTPNNGNEERLLDTFARYEILPFGHIKRDELVLRWCALDESNRDLEDAKRKCAKYVERVNALMGKRFVPHVPFFVIGILQQLEMNSGPDSSTASQGAVFEALATLRLQANFKNDIVLAKNYLAHLAFALYQSRQRYMLRAEFEQWHKGYCDEFKLQLEPKEMCNRLVDAQLLQVFDEEIGFRHRFGYYLFVAEYLARRMEDPASRQAVAQMFKEVFHEETANILIFLCFKATGHAEFVVRSMLEAAGTVFADAPVATLDSDAKEFGSAISNSKLELASLRCEERRTNLLENRDTNDGLAPYGSLRDDDLAEEASVESAYPEEMRETYAALRTIQILGQILQNFYGALNGDLKAEVTRTAYELAMRLTGWYFQILLKTKTETGRTPGKTDLPRPASSPRRRGATL